MTVAGRCKLMLIYYHIVRVAPRCSYVATRTLNNRGSDVAVFVFALEVFDVDRRNFLSVLRDDVLSPIRGRYI